MSNPILQLTPLHQAIQAGAAQTLPCLLSLRAEEAQPSTDRPSLNLALVLDVSPSMSGSAIAQARAAACLLIDRLDPKDRVALITYASTARVLMPSRLMGEARDTARRLLAAVVTREDSTALHAGWLHGAQAIAPNVNPAITSRILLLSDGNANNGERNAEVLAGEASRLLREAGIATSTYGVGDQFGELLMTSMGESGGGQAFYATEASELAGYFDTELSLLSNGVARQVSGTIEGPDGTPVAWLTGRAQTQPTVRLSDLVAGATSWVLGEVHIPATEVGQQVKLEAKASWTDNAGAAHEATVTLHVRAEAAADEEDLTVAERVREAEAARLQREAHSYVSRGDLAGAGNILRSMSAMAGSNAYVSSVAANLNTLLASGNLNVLKKEMAFSSNAMYSRQVSNDEDSTMLATDRLGLRKSVQGRSVPAAPGAAS